MRALFAQLIIWLQLKLFTLLSLLRCTLVQNTGQFDILQILLLLGLGLRELDAQFGSMHGRFMS